MYSLQDIKSRSESPTELVVGYIDAMELLYIFEQNNTRVLGWEGWLKHPDGSVGHSQKHQGTTDLSNMPNSSAIALIKGTIMQANTEWNDEPEASDTELLFCITTNKN